MASPASPRSGLEAQAKLSQGWVGGEGGAGGDYNSQQHLQQPQQPGFPPDRGQVAMMTGAPGANRRDRKAKAVINTQRQGQRAQLGAWGDRVDGNALRHTQERGWGPGHESEGHLAPDLESSGFWAPPRLPRGLWGQRSSPSPQEGPAQTGPFPQPGDAGCESRGWKGTQFPPQTRSPSP